MVTFFNREITAQKGDVFMKRMIFFLCFILICLVGGNTVFAQDDIKRHPSCPLCGMDRQQYAHSRMFIEYAEKKTTGTCSIHCTASEIAVNRDKTLVATRVADYHTKKLIPAEKAFWVIGGSKTGVMTKRAKWAFKEKEDAEKFIKENGGRPATYQDAMKATFGDMHEDIKVIREKRKMKQTGVADVKNYPECKYCGMIREKYAHSRALIEYDEGTVVATCSVHCLAIDLALNVEKTPKAMMVGDYYSKRLVDAEKAFWVLGGSKVGVMSIRGKWAFEEKEGASKFIKENGGQLATFDKVMKATFEDMHEILR
jgi:nitrous oxide reductase accessory protein NosL